MIASRCGCRISRSTTRCRCAGRRGRNVEYQFFVPGTAGTTHSITINGRVYSHDETNPIGQSARTRSRAGGGN